MSLCELYPKNVKENDKSVLEKCEICESGGYPLYVKPIPSGGATFPLCNFCPECGRYLNAKTTQR